MRYAEEMEFGVRDSVRGIVSGGSRKGLYIELEDGQRAFAGFGTLARGTEVLCTILKPARDHFLTLVSIDAVVGGDMLVA